MSRKNDGAAPRQGTRRRRRRGSQPPFDAVLLHGKPVYRGVNPHQMARIPQKRNQPRSGWASAAA
ncbi:hypothetical protein ACFOLD_15935 [Kocuria carniphila]|uniref:hypothetical protein n=1 Tax=Kocuria carniphila TaxID=262208 RepID=UPI00361E9AB2